MNDVNDNLIFKRKQSVLYEEHSVVSKIVQGGFVLFIFTKPKDNWRCSMIKQLQTLNLFPSLGADLVAAEAEDFVVLVALSETCMEAALENRKDRNSCLMLRKWGKMSQSTIPLCGHWSVGSDSNSVLNHPGVWSQPVLLTPFFRPAPKIMESVLRQECHGAPILPLAFFF